MKRSSGSWIDRLERKYGRFAIPNLMKYLTILYIIGIVTVYLGIYYPYLHLDINRVLHGEIWRLITFIIYPPQIVGGNAVDLFMALISIAFYYFIGNTLERAWGSFKFCLYYFSGILACVLAGIIAYVILGPLSVYIITTDYLFDTLFFAYALMYPNQSVLLGFIIPIKVKWMALVYGAFTIRDLYVGVKTATDGENIGALSKYGIVHIITIVLCMLNFIILFLAMKKSNGMNSVQNKRMKEYNKKVTTTLRNKRHVCTFCGITDKDNPDMEFRYCSRCDGNKEYCMEHLFTHEHIKKIVVNIDKDKK